MRNIYDEAAQTPLKNRQEYAAAGFWLVPGQKDKLEVLTTMWIVNDSDAKKTAREASGGFLAASLLKDHMIHIYNIIIASFIDLK